MASRSVAETEGLGQRLGQRLPAGAVVALEGEMGAGKTALTRGIGAGLQVRDPVTSPTFVLEHRHTGGRLVLRHVDLYRVDDPAAAADLLDDDLGEPAVLVVEWPGRYPDLAADLVVTLSVQDDDERLITFLAVSPAGAEAIQGLR